MRSSVPVAPDHTRRGHWLRCAGLTVGIGTAVAALTISTAASATADGAGVSDGAGGELHQAERITNTDPPSPAPENAVAYDTTTFPLTHGFEEAFSFRPDTRGDTHSAAELSVADAAFVPVVITGPITGTLTIWRPPGATVWIDADLRSPGGDGVQSATFTHEPDSIDERGPEVAGRHFFNDGRVRIDLNGDGEFDFDNGEAFDITGGTFTLQRLGDRNARLSFNVQLENGVVTTGSFEGSFPLFDNNPTPQ